MASLNENPLNRLFHKLVRCAYGNFSSLPLVDVRHIMLLGLFMSTPRRKISVRTNPIFSTCSWPKFVARMRGNIHSIAVLHRPSAADILQLLVKDICYSHMHTTVGFCRSVCPHEQQLCTSLSMNSNCFKSEIRSDDTAHYSSTCLAFYCSRVVDDATHCGNRVSIILFTGKTKCCGCIVCVWMHSMRGELGSASVKHASCALFPSHLNLK